MLKISCLQLTKEGNDQNSQIPNVYTFWKCKIRIPCYNSTKGKILYSQYCVLRYKDLPIK